MPRILEPESKHNLSISTNSQPSSLLPEDGVLLHKSLVPWIAAVARTSMAAPCSAGPARFRQRLHVDLEGSLGTEKPTGGKATRSGNVPHWGA